MEHALTLQWVDLREIRDRPHEVTACQRQKQARADQSGRVADGFGGSKVGSDAQVSSRRLRANDSTRGLRLVGALGRENPRGGHEAENDDENKESGERSRHGGSYEGECGTGTVQSDAAPGERTKPRQTTAGACSSDCRRATVASRRLVLLSSTALHFGERKSPKDTVLRAARRYVARSIVDPHAVGVR